MSISVPKIALVITGAILINALLFYSIGALHQLFSPVVSDEKAQQPQQRIVMQRVRQPEKKPQKQRRQLRKIHSSGGRQMTGKMDLRFSPDLSAASGTGVAMQQSQLENVVFEEGETDEPLVPVRVSPLPYPDRARDLGITGKLIFEMIIGRDGKVRSFEVIESPHPSITAAARKTIQTWRFKPAKNQGIPVEVRVSQEIEFKLQ